MNPPDAAPKTVGIDLKQGYLRGCLLPSLTVLLVVCAGAYAVRRLCIEGTIFDTRYAVRTRTDLYFNAQRDFSDGNLTQAALKATEILTQVPNHPQANVLMAKIYLARTNRLGALKHLRQCLDSSLDRDEVQRWIQNLETAQRQPSP